MLRIIRAPLQSTIIEANKTSHFTRQAAISPAVTMVQKPGADLFSSSAAISRPANALNIAAPITKASEARPKEGSSCSAFASGGPTARAPQEGQPRQRSPLTPEPQEGQIIKCRKPLQK